MRGLRKNQSTLVILTAFLLLVGVLSFHVRSLADGEQPHTHTWQDGVCTECNYECDHSGNTAPIMMKQLTPSTCSATGQMEYFQRCSICNTSVTTVPIDPYAHTWTLTSSQEMNDCKGSIAQYTCEECGKTMILMTQSYAHKFTWDEEAGAMNPNCINDGCDFRIPDGDGTKDSPYQLSTINDLYWFAQWVNTRHTDVCAVLTNDIEFMPYELLGTDGLPTSLDFVFKWIPIGSTTEHPFCGSFDGQGHSISGFVCIDAEDSYDGVGLFGVVSKNAEIKNVSVRDSFFYGYQKPTGAIAGYWYGDFDEILNGTSSYHTQIQRCSSDATVMGQRYAGGIVGCIGAVSASSSNAETLRMKLSNGIYNCVFSGHVICTMSDNGGGIVGLSGYTDSVSRCANLGHVSYYPSGASCVQYGENYGAIYCNGTRSGGADTRVSSCYTLHYPAQGQYGKALTTAQVESGAMCYLVGMHSFVNDACVYCGALKSDLQGSGTEEDPYQIISIDELLWFSNNVTSPSYLVLMNDIVANEGLVDGNHTVADLSDRVFISDLSLPNGSTLDGNGHVIEGFLAEQEYGAANTHAVFGSTRGSTIKNLIIKDCVLHVYSNGTYGSTYDTALSLVLSASDSNFINCGAYGVLSTKAYSSTQGAFITGFSPQDCVYQNCFTLEWGYSYDPNEGTTYAYGSFPSYNTLNNCYCYGAEEATLSNGVIAKTYDQVISGELCYLLNGDQQDIVFYQDLSEQNDVISFSGPQVYYGYTDCSDSTPEYSNDELYPTVEHQYENGICAYCGALEGLVGDGSKANPYQLSDADQLYWFASQVNDEGRNTICAILTDDIVVNDKVLKDHKPVSSNLRKWTPIGWNAYTEDHVNYPNTYAGTFDGNGHTIWGLYCNEPDMDYVGLFGIVTEGVIKNLSVKDSYFCGFDYVGGIVGVINPDSYSECAGVVRECYFNGTVEGRSNLGGICGMLCGASNRRDRREQGLEYDDSLIAYCYVSGRVRGLDEDDSIWIGAVVGMWYSGEILYNHYEGGVAVDGNNMTQCGLGTNWKGHVEEDDPDMTRRVISSWADSHLFCTNCTLHGDLSTHNDPSVTTRACEHCQQPMPVAAYTVAVYSRMDTSSASVANVSVSEGAPFYADEPVTVTAPDLTTEGYSFLGWYEVLEDNGSNVTQYGERLSTALEYTFKITQDSKCVAVYHAMGNGKVTIHTINGAKFYVSSDPSTLNNSLAAEFPLGTVLTIRAADAEEVLQWQNENDKLLGRGDSLTITVTGNMTISLVYKTVENGQSFVQFVSDYGQVLSYQQYSSSSNVTMPPVPSKMGFTGIGWLFEDGTEADAETIKARIGGVDLITLKPKYEASNEKGTLKIQYYSENAPIAGVDEVTYANLPYGTGKSVTAPEISNYKFSHWAKADGTPLGYQKDYYVLINSADVTIRACYVAEGEVTIAQPVIAISELSAINDNGILKLRATVTRSIPDGYTLIEHGVLYARDFASPSEENFTYEASNTEGSGVSRYISDTTSMSGAVTLNMKVADGYVKCTQRGYMVLKNNTTGNYEYHYSELKTGSYNEINQ